MDSFFSGTVTTSFLAGAISGTLSTLMLQPLDLVKTRIQSPTLIGPSPGMMAVAASVVQKESFLALWTGVGPSLARCVPGVGLYFGTLSFMIKNFGSSHTSVLESLVMGTTARCITSTIMLPITVIKTRVEGGFQCRGITDALVTTYKGGGLRVVSALYSGLAPTLLRDAPYSGLYLMFYIQIKARRDADRTLCVAPLVAFSNGLLASALASLVTQPADVVKTAVQLCPKKYCRLRDAVIFISQERGWVGFWRGSVPRTLRRMLVTAFTWTMFEQIICRYNIKGYDVAGITAATHDTVTTGDIETPGNTVTSSIGNTAMTTGNDR